jgi:hypothetical protein
MAGGLAHADGPGAEDVEVSGIALIGARWRRTGPWSARRPRDPATGTPQFSWYFSSSLYPVVLPISAASAPDNVFVEQRDENRKGGENEMQEVCYCGRVCEIKDREPVLDCGEGYTALRCPECGHPDRLEWLPSAARWPVLKEAFQRRTALRLPAT